MGKWLISYEYSACYKYENCVRRNAPTGAIEIIDEHPAVFLANSKIAFIKLLEKPFDPGQPERAVDVNCILCALQVPDGLLTAKQMYALIAA